MVWPDTAGGSARPAVRRFARRRGTRVPPPFFVKPLLELKAGTRFAGREGPE